MSPQTSPEHPMLIMPVNTQQAASIAADLLDGQGVETCSSIAFRVLVAHGRNGSDLLPPVFIAAYCIDR